MLKRWKIKPDDEPSAAVQLRRLHSFMTVCWKCESKVHWQAEVCEACGEELMENGKH